MKKVLLGTSALALAGAFATPAASAEWSVKVGGYMEQYLAFASSDNNGGMDITTGSTSGGSPIGTTVGIDGDYDGVDIKSDAEIHFSPSITLDNGIKIGARIELEGATNGDQIDENYLYVEGSFGRVSLGEDDNAAYIMAYGAPDVTFVNINSGSDTKWLPFAANYGTTTTYPSVEGDSQGIRYFTPRVAGFQAGVSYARDANRATVQAQQDVDVVNHDVIGVGANYVNSFGDFNVALSGGWTTMSVVGAPDPDAWQVGLNVGFGGFTVGGSYYEKDPGATSGDALGPLGFGTGSNTIKTYDVGASYETGPWGFSLTYLHSSNPGDSGSNASIDKYMAGANYALAQGVNLGAFIIYEDGKDVWDVYEFCGECGPGDSAGDGFIIGTGIKVSF